ncbi:hypothetical protein COCON_G00015390 [Conger conger]|uniref:Conotoxin n=1 Tax=Conger conger TaxID=82655 RepID=A0A9Q1E3B6_CONCO|nr:hypothetical protein COCON_G00015390 [Conger conger]
MCDGMVAVETRAIVPSSSSSSSRLLLSLFFFLVIVSPGQASAAQIGPVLSLSLMCPEPGPQLPTQTPVPQPSALVAQQ